MTTIHAHTIYQRGKHAAGRPLKVHEAENDGTIVISDTETANSGQEPRAYHLSEDQAAALSDALWEASGRRKPLSVREAEERTRRERADAFARGHSAGFHKGVEAARADIRKALGL